MLSLASLRLVLHRSRNSFFLKKGGAGFRSRYLEQTRWRLAYLSSGLDGAVAAQKAQEVSECLPPDIEAWKRVLEELHESGAPLQETLEAFLRYLESSLSLELDRHLERVPQRVQVLLLVFFTPPAFFVLFAPWILGFSLL